MLAFANISHFSQVIALSSRRAILFAPAPTTDRVLPRKLTPHNRRRRTPQTMFSDKGF